MEQQEQTDRIPKDFRDLIIYHLDCIDLATKSTPPEWFDSILAEWEKCRIKSVTCGFNK